MKVLYTPRALADLLSISAYLHERSPDAARAVVAAVEDRIGLLVEFPFIAPMTDTPNIYELTVMRYPYKVYYRIKEEEEVWIVHIRDARRKPWEPEQ